MLDAADEVRQVLVDGYEQEDEEHADKKGDADLSVEQVERDGYLKGKAPQLMQTGEAVGDRAGVDGHVVDALADRVLAELAQLHAHRLAVDGDDERLAHAHAQLVERVAEVDVEERGEQSGRQQAADEHEAVDELVVAAVVRIVGRAFDVQHELVEEQWAGETETVAGQLHQAE